MMTLFIIYLSITPVCLFIILHAFQTMHDKHVEQLTGHRFEGKAKMVLGKPAPVSSLMTEEDFEIEAEQEAERSRAFKRDIDSTLDLEALGLDGFDTSDEVKSLTLDEIAAAFGEPMTIVEDERNE
jgi:hypothetical protein